MMLRVASWPMGFIIIAKGERKLFFWVEFLSNASFAALVWAGLRAFGLNGTGMAFFALYLLNFIGLYLVVRRLSGFRWSAANRRLAVLLLPLVTTVFVSWYFLSRPAIMISGALLTVLTGIYSARTLCALIPLERFPGPVQKVILFFRLAPSHPEP
jgi:PST family polysaccharide transporter